MYLKKSKIFFIIYRIILKTYYLYFNNIFKADLKKSIINKINFKKNSLYTL